MLTHKRLICCLVAFSVVLLFGAVSAPAAESPRKTVRVGYYEGDPRLQDGFADTQRKSGYAYEYYQRIASMTGWDYEYIYGSRQEILKLLAAGQVDIAAGIAKIDLRQQQVYFSEADMGLDPPANYFAVSRSRPELLAELNAAMEEIHNTSPKFAIALYQKYYAENLELQVLSDEERVYLAGLGPLYVGYVKDNMPFSDMAGDGTPDGIAKVLIDHLADYLQVPVEGVCYNTINDMERALGAGEIHAAFPIYSDLWLSESRGIFQTDTIFSDRVMVVYSGNYRSNLLDRVALSETGLGQRNYLAAHFPESELVYYPTRSAAFEAIQKGEISCMVGSAGILQRFMAEHTEFHHLHVAHLETSEDFCIAVNRSDHTLVQILNKAIASLDDATLTSGIVRYSNADTPFTILDVIRQYAILVVFLLFLFITTLLLAFVSYHHKTKQFNTQQERAKAVLADALNAANAANAAKTLFLSNMSHDIRTPMNGIIGMTAIAATHLDDTARVKDCLTKITSSSKHLLELINEVLDMSKIESGKVDLNEEPCSLSELMNGLLLLNKPLAEAKGQELVVHIVDVTHEQVIGDGLRIQQVFTNLVSNAIKYTPDGGRIEITLAEKHSGSPVTAYFEFTVKDNGIGMSEEFLPHVFDAFSRADEKSVSRVQGTGLGMPLARNIVRMMGGDITVESTLGVGSTFVASMLLNLPESENATYDEFLDLNILVVDDDQTICESTCSILTGLGMDGEWVLSGREAVERVEQHHRDGSDYFAVLLDWQMPDMDGIETTREIRRRVGREVPIIVISAYDWSAIEAEALEAGVDAFVGKPLFKSPLIRLFHKLLGQETEETEPGLQELIDNSDFSGKRALLAEDNDLNAEIAMAILEETGLEVEWAHNGREALEMMERSKPGYYNCIFMDVQMPMMNGMEAARAIRELARPDSKTIPIFAMTANVFADDVAAAKASGMNEHIPKPLNFDVLMQVLTTYLGPTRAG